MASHYTKRRRNKNTVTGILVGVLIGFGFFALFQAMQTDRKLAEEAEKNQENTETAQEKRTLNEDDTTSASDDLNESEAKTEEKQEEDVDQENDADKEETAIGGTDGDPAGKTNVYTNETFNVRLTGPADWGAHSPTTNQAGFVPPGKTLSSQYQGDITVSFKENPEGLKIREFYNGENATNLFEDAGGAIDTLTVNETESVIFKEVEGYAPSNIIIVPIPGGFVEITDTGMSHEENGIHENIAKSLEFISE